MQNDSWNKLQHVWKGEKKPEVDMKALKAEVRRRKNWKRFNVIVETGIVLAVISITLYYITDRVYPVDYVLLGQLWFITILALTFNFWNRSSLKKADSYALAHYLQILLNESVKKKRTAVFVFVLTILNLLFYLALILWGYVSVVNIPTMLSALGLLLIYFAWSVWYYKISASNIDYYRQELEKIRE